MSVPYFGEIRIFGGNFAPQGWVLCDGSLLPISENEALYTLIGTTYGGDGVTTFGVPDLRGRAPIGQGQGPGLSNRVIGQSGGVEQVTLTVPQMPAHTHIPVAATTASQTTPEGGVWAAQSAAAYSDAAPDTPLAAAALLSAGGNLPHENMPPYVTVNYIIAVGGIFPTQG